MKCTEGTKAFCSQNRRRKEGEEEGLSQPAAGGRKRLSEGGDGKEGLRGGMCPTEGGQGALGWRRGPELTAGFSLPPPSLSHTCDGWRWAHPGGTAAHLWEGPPIPPHLLGWQGPPLVVGDSGHSTLHPASSRVTWTAGSGGGGCRLSAPSSPGGSGSGPHAAALPGPDSGPWRRRPRQQKP